MGADDANFFVERGIGHALSLPPLDCSCPCMQGSAFARPCILWL